MGSKWVSGDALRFLATISPIELLQLFVNLTISPFHFYLAILFRPLHRFSKPRRYFMEETAKPGQLSDELRVALGMSKKSLPIWIHRMRILGYPPGWLRKADMTNTTINFIDGETDAGQREVEGEFRGITC